jgi:flagellar FliJ protein
MTGKKRPFRLEQVLNLRRETEKTRMLEFADARQRLDGEALRLQHDEESTDQVNGELLDKQRQGMSALELQLYADYLHKKGKDLKRQRKVVNDLGEEVDERRESLLDASKDKKALEKLKEQKHAALRRELAEREQNFLDEIAITSRREKK